MRLRIYIGLLLAIVALAIFLMSCSGGSKPGTVNTSISDPPTCAAPQGPYRHVYVTVNDVLIHQSASASANDAGWIHLASGLKDNPLQVDLLGVANQCFLAMLGSAEIEPGTYQQIRVVLAPNSASVNNNKCGNVANCLMLTSDPSDTPQALQLSSETQTGIKIPSGQIAGGSFTIGSGQTKDLNIDFDACGSVVVQGSGKYRLKPVLHAGEVSLQSASSSISGTIIDGSAQPIDGGNTVVALEQTDGTVVMEAVPASNGSFVFCPVADGTYNLVAVAIDGSGNAYAATAITGVKAGDSLGTVPLTTAGLPASVTGPGTPRIGGSGGLQPVECADQRDGYKCNLVGDGWDPRHCGDTWIHRLSVSARPATRCLRVMPSRYSIAMNHCPSWFAISYMVQILGWFRADAARASRRKRSRTCGSLETSSGRNFSAAKRPSMVSSAL